MENQALLEMIEKLPADKQREVENLVEALLFESDKISVGETINENIVKVKERMRFGDLKGFVKYISDDFDAPLEDFKDYTN